MKEFIITKIISLYEKNGASNYIGENLSQTEHMIQSAMLAEDAKESPQVIIAAFLHDIGHLIELQNNSVQMELLGVQNHEEIGREYLLKMGISKKIANLVGNHVKSKRYLTQTDPSYFSTLSEASKKTFIFQGGAMNETEMKEFELDELFAESIRLRKYDDQAKIPDLKIKSLDYYAKMMMNHLDLSSKKN